MDKGNALLSSEILRNSVTFKYLEKITFGVSRIAVQKPKIF